MHLVAVYGIHAIVVAAEVAPDHAPHAVQTPESSLPWIAVRPDWVIQYTGPAHCALCLSCKTMLIDVPLAPVSCKQQTSTGQSEGPIASEHLPITIKHPSSPDPKLPQPTAPSCRPPADDTSMPASPCIIPCTAADCTHVSMDTCMSPPQQQQPQPQSDHIMQQPQLQQQSWSQGSQHSSSGHAVTAGAPHQTHGNLSDMGTQRPDGSTLLECKSLVSLGEHPGQSSVGRAASSMEEKADRQQEMGRQQEMHGRLGWHGSAAGGDTARTQVSSSTFLDGLRPGSPSQRCSPEAAARATPAHLLAGQLCCNRVCYHCVGSDVFCSPTLASWECDAGERGPQCLCGLTRQHHSLLMCGVTRQHTLLLRVPKDYGLMGVM